MRPSVYWSQGCVISQKGASNQMQKFSTIIGIIELRQEGINYRTISSRYNIGSSTITLIMERFRNLGFTLDELRVMNPEENL